MYAGMVEMADRRIYRVSELLFLGTEIGDRVAFLNRTCMGNSTTGGQKCLGELSFAGMAGPNEAHVSDVSGGIGHLFLPPLSERSVAAYRTASDWSHPVTSL